MSTEQKSNTQTRRNGSRSKFKKRRPQRPRVTPEQLIEAWKPITELGRRVKNGEVKSLDQIFAEGETIKESMIVDALVPGIHNDLLLIGQAKGKFGGGKRRIFRQTQKKTREGNTIKFTTCAVVGDKNGHVGVAFGKSKETVPARDKSIVKAKLNLIKIRRGCGSWEGGADVNSIPYAVQGKCGSTIITLLPAPKGTGLCIEKECAKILEAAGIQDIWSQTKGQTKTKVNLIQACMDALGKLSEMKIQSKHIQALGIVEGSVAKEANVTEEETLPVQEMAAGLVEETPPEAALEKEAVGQSKK